MKKQMQKGFTLIELMIVVAIIAILAAIAIPQYQNYVARSQASRAMAELGAVKTAVETCMLDGRTSAFGTNAGECDLGWTTSTLFGAAETNPQTGVLVKINDDSTAQIEGTLGGKAATILKDKKIDWSRTADGSWACKSNMDAKFRPSGCTDDL